MRKSVALGAATVRVCGAIICSIWDFDCFDYVVRVFDISFNLLILRNEPVRAVF